MIVVIVGYNFEKPSEDFKNALPITSLTIDNNKYKYGIEIAPLLSDIYILYILGG
ncbi:hypothetical protein ACYI5F_003036 [Listeria monocytogenes]